MKTKTLFTGLIVLSSMSNPVGAGDVNWSTATVKPVGETTVRVYGLKYAPTPDLLYIADLNFNEETLNLEADLSSLMAVDETKYDEADLVRGGLLYDKWWKVNGEVEPSDTHFWYPGTGSQSGSTTWRCKECHGWDYKGNEGTYEEGSHYTGIAGLYQVKNQSIAYIYRAIVDHGMPLSEEDDINDIFDLTKFLKEGMVDMNKYIIFSGTQRKVATGDAGNGQLLYDNQAGCLSCHGEDGNKISSVSVGAVANENPWSVLHKIRFGKPGTRISSTIDKGLSLQDQIDILTYAQTLPQFDTGSH